MKAPTENLERNKKILEQRNLGRTLKSIGDEFGLSTARIRTICLQQERLKRRIEQGGVFLLSSRAQSVIKFHEYDDNFKWSYDYLIKIPNCGRKTTKEILEYIEGLD